MWHEFSLTCCDLPASRCPRFALCWSTRSWFSARDEFLVIHSPTFSFLILFILFIVALEFNSLDSLNVAEGVFMIYALGFTLEKVAAMQEHGITGDMARQLPRNSANHPIVYFKGTWVRLFSSLSSDPDSRGCRMDLI